MATPVLLRLETERLVLRAGEPADATTFRTLWTERDDRVPPHRRIGADGRPTVEDIADRLRTEPAQQPLRLLTVVRRGSGDVLGYCGLIAHGNGSPEEPELAYELLRSAQGRGHATEAARAVVSWADGAGFRRLWAGVWDWNTASRRVLRKLGFAETGRIAPSSVHGHTLLAVRERGDHPAEARPTSGDRGPR